MNMEIFALGPLETNAAVVWAGSQAVLFDCPDDPGSLVRFMTEKQLTLVRIFLTHAHADHMAGLDLVLKSFPQAEVFQHKSEDDWLANPQLNLSSWMGPPQVSLAQAQFLDDGQLVDLAVGSMKVLHVPGHSPGSLFYIFEKEKIAFGGDLLFRGSVGRWDFPGSDERSLRKSLAKVMDLPDDLRVYPGHGPSTTIGKEKTSNPYLRK